MHEVRNWITQLLFVSTNSTKMLTNDIMCKYMFPLKFILMYKNIVPTYI